MYGHRIKKTAKGIFGVNAAEIFFYKLHTFKFRSTQTYRIVSSNMNFVGGELRAVKLKESTDSACYSGAVKNIWSIEDVF